ncbi:MAG TPA: hypothetical protein VGF48_18270 [Thermoanaerobaculia bacterium]|jgi:hypothetical protein
MANERLSRTVEGGMSVIVGSVDANGVATCCRGVAISTSDDFDTVTVYLPVATSQETLANVATTRRVAILCTNPLDHLSIQMKGLSRGVRVANDSELTLVKERLEQWADALDTIGVPRRVTRGTAHWPAFAIDVSVEEVFDQTPGPKAGNALK